MAKITFSVNESLEDVFPSPVKSSLKIPEFYKKMPSQTGVSPQNGTVKRCIPFLDALTQGFIIPLWADMYVRAEEGDFHLEFPNDFPLNSSVENHDYLQIQGHPLSEELYGKIAMKFMNPWVIETPKGYSTLFTSPLNHLETRFKILDGVVDTDTYYTNINFPFLWTGGDGEFFIPKGTPLVQVIPFKREEFDLSIGVVDEKRRRKTTAKLGTFLKNGYKKLFWHKSLE